MTTLFLVLGVVLLVAGLSLATQPAQKALAGVFKRVSTGLLALSFLFWLFNNVLESVPAGYRGILLVYGKPSGILNEGLNFISPIGTDVQLIEVRTQKASADATAPTKDLQNIHTSLAVNFHPDPRTVADLYQKVGMQYEARIIDPAVQETVKAALGQFTARDIIQRREEVKQVVSLELAKRLAPYDLIVEQGGVSLTNFEFSEAFTNSIEASAQAQQDAITARNQQQKIKIEAENTLTKAKAEAESKLIAARGDAMASQIRAKALNSQGGSKVLAQQWIEAWKAGGSQVPQIVSGGNQNFMLNLDTLLKANQGG